MSSVSSGLRGLVVLCAMVATLVGGCSSRPAAVEDRSADDADRIAVASVDIESPETEAEPDTDPDMKMRKEQSVADADDAEAEPEAADDDNEKVASPQQIALKWATVVLIRAREMVEGSDEVDVIVTTAMQNTGHFRTRLMQGLSDDGRTPTDSVVFVTRIETAIRSTTREFVLRAKSMRESPDPAPESEPKQEKGDSLIA